jgi:O-antigen/teichoic acid export membrane protein
MNSSIATRTVQGSFYSVLASGITILLGFIRATLMARMLLPEHFGVVALALFFTNLFSQLSNFGIANAYIHRQDEDENLRATYFTLSFLVKLGSRGILAAMVPLLIRFYPDYTLLGPVIIANILFDLILMFNHTQTTILSKRLEFSRLAMVDVISSFVMTVIGPSMAWAGWGVWSIIGERFSGIIARTTIIGVAYRPWRPHFGWDKNIVKWFWDYGRKVWTGVNLGFILEQFDDFWIGTTVGKSPLGFYSKAYEFARYPRRVIANPILSVFLPTFAHLQDNRLRLSRAFFRSTSIMVRAGCLFSLVFILTAPEFIRIFIGEKWLPMLLTFQLMIVYTLLDPLSMAARNLLMATGHPGAIARIRGIQVVVFIPAVVGLSWLWDIEGAALAADLMVLVGAILLFHRTQQVADYSARTLWFWPLAATGMISGVVLGLSPFWANVQIWSAFLLKIALISALFIGLLWITERDQLKTGWQMIWGLIRPQFRKGNYRVNEN